jgi:hypothetical protein
MPGDLLDGIQHRRQAEVADHFGIARHMAGEDENLGAFTQRLPQHRALFGGRDEEFPDTGAGEHPRHARCPQTIAVRFDHGTGFGVAAAFGVQCPPIGKHGVQINAQGSSSHSAVLTGRAARSRGKRWHPRKVMESGGRCPPACGLPPRYLDQEERGGAAGFAARAA